ncbi:22/33 kDa [Guinea pig adenovirus 1]|uniref:22/33 kDa n=1 Tax=Guinea pig adenovirus 1 TaxID=2847100 RepID=A0AC61LZX4_9ADEN|nr:22/33 kDa [Guinea pig adenovirus]QIZ64167.1 22/33 kDa [Guinea pig adenovirus 1]QIZ64199.1 22/33 kDa [Guinea pig adenovirus]
MRASATASEPVPARPITPPPPSPPSSDIPLAPPPSPAAATAPARKKRVAAANRAPLREETPTRKASAGKRTKTSVTCRKNTGGRDASRTPAKKTSRGAKRTAAATPPTTTTALPSSSNQIGARDETNGRPAKTAKRRLVTRPPSGGDGDGGSRWDKKTKRAEALHRRLVAPPAPVPELPTADQHRDSHLSEVSSEEETPSEFEDDNAETLSLETIYEEEERDSHHHPERDPPYDYEEREPGPLVIDEAPVAAAAHRRNGKLDAAAAAAAARTGYRSWRRLGASIQRAYLAGNGDPGFAQRLLMHQFGVTVPRRVVRYYGAKTEHRDDAASPA